MTFQTKLSVGCSRVALRSLLSSSALQAFSIRPHPRWASDYRAR